MTPTHEDAGPSLSADALVLRTLGRHDEEAFLRAYSLTAVSDPNFARLYRPGLAFEAFLRILEDYEHDRDLPEADVPSALLFGFVGAEIVGRLSLRYRLNDFFLHEGGHIGYVVVPGHRRRGFAQEMLKQGLDRARSIGFDRVLVTCDEDNVISRHMIEKAGGEYEDSYVDPENRLATRRYWITLAKP